MSKYPSKECEECSVVESLKKEKVDAINHDGTFKYPLFELLSCSCVPICELTSCPCVKIVDGPSDKTSDQRKI